MTLQVRDSRVWHVSIVIRKIYSVRIIVTVINKNNQIINDRQSSVKLEKGMILRAREGPNGRRNSRQEIKCKDILGPKESER